MKLRTSILSALSSTRAAFDLASVMVGVIVIGIIGTVVGATVFTVIPWAKDNAAKASLGAVYTAESAYMGVNQKYTDYETLKGLKLISESTSIKVVTPTTPPGTCWLAVTKSDTNRIYYNDSFTNEPKEYVASTPPADSSLKCGGLSALQASVTNLS